ncbi:MAG: glutamate--tRNA ligase [Gemmatimonadota bacterium]|jgi:glutamyl-tRNA synthetase
MTVRTRFAPSPTGRLHLGNVRTAVFNWLFARHHGGAFLLRVEDTDVERNVERAEEALLEDLRWLGLDWDEGPDRGGPHAPYRQSQRRARYWQVADELVSVGLAYPCFCTEEELEKDREEVGEGSVLRYSGRCRHLGPAERSRLEGEGRPFAVRFAVPADLEHIDVEDEIRGSISFPVNDITDFVMIRTDGRPTYNFAVVVDDVDMEITHVIRGAGHLPNTPRQAVIFDALGRDRPAFAHLPTVLSPAGGKLSKREGAASLDALRERGVPPDAVVNYLSLLGWSSPDEREVLSRNELVERISLDRVGASDTTWDPEKLRWVAHQHLAAMPLDDLVRAVEPFIDRERFPDAPRGGPRLRVLVDTLRSRLTALGEIDEHLARFCYPTPEQLDAAGTRLRADPEARRVLVAVQDALRDLDPWDRQTVDQAVRAAGKSVSARGRGLFHPLREAMMGCESGPDLAGIIAAVGPGETQARLGRALAEGQV